jgi:hypothetical protein
MYRVSWLILCSVFRRDLCFVDAVLVTSWYTHTGTHVTKTSSTKYTSLRKTEHTHKNNATTHDTPFYIILTTF